MEHVGELLRLGAPARKGQVAATVAESCRSWGTGRWTLVLRAVAKAHRPDLALQLLELIGSGRIEADVFHYSAAITSVKSASVGGPWPTALSMLQQAEDSGISPNEYTFGSVMRGLAHWLLALDCIRRMQQIRVGANDVVHTALLDTHSHQHQWARALSQHESLCKTTRFTCAPVMSACEKGSEWPCSIALLSSMRKSPRPQCSPDLVCYGSAVSACSQRWQAAVALLEQVTEESLERNAVCYNAAISSCTERWEAALCLFEGLCQKKIEPGVCCATTAHICQSWEATLRLLEWQLSEDIIPDAAMAGSVLQAVKEHAGEAGAERAERLLSKLLDLWARHLPQEGILATCEGLEEENILVNQPGLVVVSKPPGVTTERTAMAITASAQGAAFHVVSRLDAPTSGVLPFAVGQVAARYLQAQFAGRLVRKEYICLCQGAPLGEVGTTGKISHPLLTTGVDGLNSRTEVSVTRGRDACTVYLVKSRYDAGTSLPDTELVLLRVRILTGRTHQIRVHLASIGRPVVGDVVYGTGLTSISPRLFLHCERLRIRDLEGGLRTVRAPLARDLAESLSKLANSGAIAVGFFSGFWAGHVHFVCDDQSCKTVRRTCGSRQEGTASSPPGALCRPSELGSPFALLGRFMAICK